MSESDGPENTRERRALKRKLPKWSLLRRIEEANKGEPPHPDSVLGRDRAVQHFCVEWTAASLVFWILGIAVTDALGIDVSWNGVGVASGAVNGIVSGITQWIVLRNRIRGAGWWLLASIGGGLVSGVVSLAVEAVAGVDELVAGIIAGAVRGVIAGTAQWFLLENQVHHAGWWILASTVGGSLGWMLVMTKVLVDAITGFVLANLLQRPISEA